MKKNYFLLAVWILLALPCLAQNIAINADGSLPNSNAILDIKSGNKGILIPRLDSIARKAIPGTKGLLVYDTTTNSFWYNTGTQWQNITAGPAVLSLSVADSAWLLTGNGNAHDTVNFLGTTNNVPLNIRVNNQPSGRIDPTKANTFWGYQSGMADTGSNNTASGALALKSNTSGNFNTATGSGSLFSNVTGFVNAAYGFKSLYFNNSGYRNTAIGVNALYSNTTGTDNTAVGYQALYSTAIMHEQTAVGFQALYSNTTGIGNVATGFQALYSNTSGEENTAQGYQAIYTNTTGQGLTAVGYRALQYNTTGTYNTAIGVGALSINSTGSFNIAIGGLSLGQNNTGNDNSAFGFQSLFFNHSGEGNTAYGPFSLEFNSNGNNNTAMGTNSLQNNTSGSNNIGIGDSSMQQNTTGNFNTVVGNQADVNTGNLSNATAIGYGAIVDASNKVRIGNSAVTVIEGQVPFTTPSDGRYKFNVQEDVKGLDFILQLRPVTYQFDVQRFDAQLNRQSARQGQLTNGQPANYAMQTAYDEATRIRRSGFIAQEVERAANATGYDFSGIIKPKTDQDHYSLSYDAFVVPLVKAIQEQHFIITEQAKKINEQEKRIAALEQQDRQIASLQRQLNELKALLQR